MFRIWAKTLHDGKITRSYMYSCTEKYEPSEFLNYLSEICHELDIPTPVILKSHVRNYNSFNITKFRKEDFLEKTDFDIFQVENATE